MTGPPLVTVLIANYNYGRFLAEAIDSALQQTHRPIQVVVVDDGSRDGSRDVIASYGATITPVLRENGGQAAAVNAGLQHVDGELLVLLDADDVLLPDVVERAVAVFAAEERCVRVQFRLEMLNEDGSRPGGTVPPMRWPLLTGDLSGHVMRHRMFRSPPTSGNVWSTRAIRALPPSPEDLRTFVDRWWSELTTLLGTVRAVDGIGGCYRIHAASLHAKEGHGLEFVRTRIELTERLHEAGRVLAADAGIEGFPRDVDAALDAALIAHRIAARKLGASSRGGPMWRLALRGAYACAVLPGQPLRSRVARVLWTLVLAAAPPRRDLIDWLHVARYERGTH